MNKTLFYTFTLLAALMVACSDDTHQAGSSLLTPSDKIVVGSDTFSTTSISTSAHKIYSTPDTFLLGECDSRFGTLHADLLAQFTCPTGFQYPEGAVVDSVCLYFYYRSWFGDGETPLSLSVYEIDKQTLKYASAYSHDINVEDYVSLTNENMVLSRQRIISPKHPTDSVYNNNTQAFTSYVRMRLTDEFAARMFAIKDFSSYEDFTQQFKGLYLQSNFGSACLLHIGDISLALHYHFTYNRAGRDTTVTDIKGFYANREVRQVNRYEYINPDESKMNNPSDTINYIVSPAGMYTRVSIPVKEMSKAIVEAIGDKRPYINKAELSIKVLNVYDGYSHKTRDDWAQPAKNMLLIKESAIDRFFTKHELPSDTCAILGTLASTTDGNDVKRYYYNYDLASLLTQSIRAINDTTLQTPDVLDMMLIPVSVNTSMTTTQSYYYTASASSTISSITHEQTVSATVIRSSNNADEPLAIEVVYSGF